MDFKTFEQEREKIFEKWWGDFAKSEKRFIDSMPLILHSDRLATIRFCIEMIEKMECDFILGCDAGKDRQHPKSLSRDKLKTKLEELLK